MNWLIMLVIKWDGRADRMFAWLKNLQSFIYERRSLKIKIFKVSKDFTMTIFCGFLMPYLLLVAVWIYNYITGVMKFTKNDPVVWLIYLVCFLIYPILSSIGQHIGINKEAIWIRFCFVRCKKIQRKLIKECYIVDGVDFERHLIGETLIIKSTDNKCIYVSNRYTKKQREEIVVLLGYKDGLKSLKKKNITKD